MLSKGKLSTEARSKSFVKLISCCEGDTIFFSHDDFILYNSEYITEWFSDVESGKIDYVYFVGVNSKLLYEPMSKLYDVSFLKNNAPDWIKDKNYYPFGMTSYGFVSNLKLLLQSEGDFGDRNCKKGSFVSELNWESTMDFCIDYFHLTPLKWHSLGYKNVKSPGDGVFTDFKDRKQAPYAYLNVEDFCSYTYPYFHVCLGSFFFGNLIISPEKTKNELKVTYTSNPSSAEIIERFLYFNTGYIKLFPNELIEKYELEEFHKQINKNCSIILNITYDYYKQMGWKFNTYDHFGLSSLQNYI